MAGGEGVRQLRPGVQSNRRKLLSIHVLIYVAINSLQFPTSSSDALTSTIVNVLIDTGKQQSKMPPVVVLHLSQLLL
jgi:hypothetical protein